MVSPQADSGCCHSSTAAASAVPPPCRPNLAAPAAHCLRPPGSRHQARPRAGQELVEEVVGHALLAARLAPVGLAVLCGAGQAAAAAAGESSWVGGGRPQPASLEAAPQAQQQAQPHAQQLARPGLLQPRPPTRGHVLLPVLPVRQLAQLRLVELRLRLVAAAREGHGRLCRCGPAARMSGVTAAARPSQPCGALPACQPDTSARSAHID